MESHSSCVSITIEPINEPTPAGVSGRFKQQIHLDDTVRFDCPSNEEAHNFAARFPIASARSRFYEWEGEECCTQRRNCSILLLSLLFPIGEKSDRRKKKEGTSHETSGVARKSNFQSLCLTSVLISPFVTR